MSDLESVRKFWQDNPLFEGESKHEPGTKEYYEEQKDVIINDCLGGYFDERILPGPENRDDVLDLGCGPGFWAVELKLRGGANHITAGDLTERAVELAKTRFEMYELEGEVLQVNAENMQFPDGNFSHVNCHGVVHHTPDTQKAISEIARVLKPGGTAVITVYYRNFILRLWPFFRPFGKVAGYLGSKLKGRGREGIFFQDNPDEIVRMYDGLDNPVGKSYSKAQYIKMLEPYFEVEEIYYHFFPARSLPIPVPRWLHRALDTRIPFMIYANVRKKSD